MKVKITIFIVFFFNIIAVAQHSIAISFDETVNLGKIESTTAFQVTDPFSKTIKLKGDAINSYKFQKPGIYTIKVKQTENPKKDHCDHNRLPDEITVAVSSIKMVFIADGIIFSQPILKNKETSGIKLSIPIQIRTYNHEPVSMNATLVNSAGIGTEIVARLDKEYNKLTEGEHIISYDLNGIVHENSYLMFDFIDANGKIQPVALTKPVMN